MNRAHLHPLLPGFILSWTAIAAPADSSGSALQIRFCDEAEWPAVEFTRFPEEGIEVMAKAGVESVWMHCSVGNPAENPAGGREPMKPTGVVVRLRAKTGADRNQSLGVSAASKDGTGVHKSLHLEQIRDFAGRTKVHSTHRGNCLRGGLRKGNHA